MVRVAFALKYCSQKQEKDRVKERKKEGEREGGGERQRDGETEGKKIYEVEET